LVRRKIEVLYRSVRGQHQELLRVSGSNNFTISARAHDEEDLDIKLKTVEEILKETQACTMKYAHYFTLGFGVIVFS
jgi:hypothetical protein